MSFERIDLNYIPKDIGVDEFAETLSSEIAKSETKAVLDKLLKHAKIIKEWKERIDAIGYLADNAVKLSGNPVFIATDHETCRAIEVLGGKDGTVDFALFQKCIDLVLEGYKQMALVSLTGAK